MEHQAIFPLSVVFRLVLAMLLPIQVVLSIGVSSTTLSGFGMVWTMFGGPVEIRYLSIPIAILCGIPAILFSAYFRYSSHESYPARIALLSTLLVFMAPLVETMLNQGQVEW